MKASVLLLALGVATLARAEEVSLSPEALEHMKKGLALYEAKEYEAAVVEFQMGYSVTPSTEFLYAWAQAERLSGDCASAIPLYKRFLAIASASEEGKIGAKNLSRCEEEIRKPVQVPPAARRDSTLLELPPDEDPIPTPQRPWYRDAVGASLVAAGVVGLAVGGGFYAHYRNERADAQESATYGAFLDHDANAATAEQWAWVGVGTGVVLGVVGTAKLWLTPGVRVSPWASADSAGVLVGSSF